MGATVALVGIARAGGRAAAATSTLHSSTAITFGTAAARSINLVFHLDISSLNSAAVLVVGSTATIILATAAVLLLVVVRPTALAAMDTADTRTTAARAAGLFGRHTASFDIFRAQSTVATATHSHRFGGPKCTPKQHGSQNNAKRQNCSRSHKQQDAHNRQQGEAYHLGQA